jgi:hypothetical protein
VAADAGTPRDEEDGERAPGEGFLPPRSSKDASVLARGGIRALALSATTGEGRDVAPVVRPGADGGADTLPVECSVAAESAWGLAPGETC